MLVEPKDLVADLTGRGGEPFEHFLWDLLVLSARKLGLPFDAVNWGDRVNRPDGGKDIRVTAGTTHSAALIPGGESIWSAKAGQNAIDPNLLRDEVLHHPAIKDHLQKGLPYVYAILQRCDDAQRLALKMKAEDLCTELGIGSDMIKLIFVDQLATAASLCPTIIPDHLPSVAYRLGSGATSVENWSAKLRTDGLWTELADRSGLTEEIKLLLSGVSSERYFHLGGWSGVGKSRLVAEAASNITDSSAITVFHSWLDFDNNLHKYFDSGRGDSGILVIDEVDVRFVPTLVALTERFPGLRIVSIGPIDVNQRQPRQVKVLARPSEEDLKAIITNRTLDSLPQPVVARIANLADGDVRLAQMLASVFEDPRDHALGPYEMIGRLDNLGVFIDGYLEKNKALLGDVSRFRQFFAVVCTLADVGVDGEKTDEIIDLAKFFEYSAADLHKCIDQARGIGLCQLVGELAECIPRPIATYVFEHDSLPLVRGRELEFFKALNDERRRRAFLRRLAYCGPGRRKEVIDRLSRVFHDQYGGLGLKDLANGDVARSIRVFVETLPEIGLSWLRILIHNVTLDELKEFRGSGGMFSPSYGRREIVWLCEHLRAFDDCFDDCEAILYRLALAENEDIGNNATAEWRQCFWWVLSGTEVPFRQRVSTLIDRLTESTTDTLTLVLSAAVGAFDTPHSAMAPPEFVGGRITPPEWRPSSNNDLITEWNRLLSSLIDVSRRSREHFDFVAGAIIQNLGVIRWEGGIEQIREKLLTDAALNDSQRRALRYSIQWLLRPRNEAQEEEKQNDESGTRAFLSNWLNTIAPRSLKEQLTEVVGRETWEHEDFYCDAEQWRRIYVELAARVSDDPNILEEQELWLNSPEAKSSYSLGVALAETHSENEATRNIVLRWLSNGIATNFVLGYLVAMRTEGELPTWAIESLESIVTTQPRNAILLSIEADHSNNGFDRIMRAWREIEPREPRLISRLFGRPWDEVLSVQQKIGLLETLMNEAGSEGVQVGLLLMRLWFHKGKDEYDRSMDAVVAELIQRATKLKRVRTYEWEDLTRKWMARHPKKASNLLVATMTSGREVEYGFVKASADLLAELALTDQKATTESLIEILKDEDTQSVFHILTFRGIFERLGISNLRQIVNNIGEGAAAAIARHLPDPSSAEFGNLVDQFLSEFAGSDRVFDAYLMGRHSGKVFSGHAFDRRGEVYERTGPFLNHPNKRLRDWAVWERKDIDRWSQRDRRRVEEQGRD